MTKDLFVMVLASFSLLLAGCYGDPWLTFRKREPCVVWNPDIRPLLVGQSTHMGWGT